MSAMENSLPFYRGPPDQLRHGYRSLESERIQNYSIDNHRSQSYIKINKISRIYGSAVAMRIATEDELFGRIRRLPGLQSSSVVHQTVLGCDGTIDFSDYLNGAYKNYGLCRYLTFFFLSFLVPQMRPDLPQLQLHSVMEIKLGMH